MVKSIAIEKITSGTKLASDVRNKYGQILLGAGMELDEKHKKIFKMWGIVTVEIEDKKTATTNIEGDEALLEEAKNKLQSRLNWQPSNSIEIDIYEMALQKILSKMS
ncbi:MAG: hypothetical protein KF816_16555 [Melioribacteraceae bacterium]|nr:hypothetical protein [Melioribacteraceae bacterium]